MFVNINKKGAKFMVIKKDAVYINNGVNPNMEKFVLITGEGYLNKDIHTVEGRKISPAPKGVACSISFDKLFFTDAWFLKHYNFLYQLDWNRSIDVQNKELYQLFNKNCQ